MPRRPSARDCVSARSCSHWRGWSRMAPMPSVKKWFQNLSIAGKLTAIGVVGAAASLLIAGVILVTFDTIAEYRDQVREIGMVGNVTGINSTGAISFND